MMQGEKRGGQKQCTLEPQQPDVNIITIWHKIVPNCWQNVKFVPKLFEVMGYHIEQVISVMKPLKK
jgi:hypothetical protein